MHRVLLGTSRKFGRHIKTLCWVDINLAQKKGFKFYQHDRTQSSLTTRFQPIVSRRLLWWDLEKSYTRKYMRHLDLLRRFLFKTIGWKKWVQKLLEVVKTPNKPNQRPKNPIVRAGRSVLSEHQSGSSVQEIENVSYLAAKAPIKNRETCFPVVCQCLLNA